MIELYRAIIPRNKIINDNGGQHYRTMMGQINWLSSQFQGIFEGIELGPGNFKMPDIENVKSKLGKTVKLRFEVWKCTNTLFDPHNYAKTFKAPLDLLVKNGYLEDDNWRIIESATYTGGGQDIWNKRAIRYNDDGLPDELTPDWWRDYTDDFYTIMIRILAE